MINEAALRRLEEAGIQLGADALLILYGGLPTEQIKNTIDSEYREYRAGGEFDSNKDLKERMEDLQNTLTFAAMGGALGVDLALSKMNDRMQFQTIPALQVASQSVGRFQEALISSVRVKEDILYKYGQMGGLAAAGLTFFGRRILGNPRTLNRAAKILNRIRQVKRVAQATRAARGAASVATAAPTAGASVAAFVVSTFLESVAFFVGERVARFFANDYAEEMSGGEFARQLLDRNLVINDFLSARSPLVNVYGQVDDDFYGQLDRTRNKIAMYGLSPKDVGADYQAITQTLSDISQRMHGSLQHYEDYSAATYTLGEIYGVGSQSFVPIFSDLAMSGFKEKDIKEAKEEFENFFESVAGDGKPQIAQLQLVQELSTFARSYGFSDKFADNAPDELAKIHKFMTGYVSGGMQTTQPTQNLVRGVDSLLNEGGSARNPAMQEIMRLGGITNFEAIKGVTHNANTLNKFLHGVSRNLGINQSDFGPDGVLREQKMRQFTAFFSDSLGTDVNTQQSVLAALRGYVRGGSATEVMALYTREFQEANAESITVSPVYGLMTSIVEGNTELVRVIRENMYMLNSLNRVMLDYFEQFAPRTVEVTANFAVTASKALNEMRSSTSTTQTRAAGETAMRGVAMQGVAATAARGFSPIDFPVGTGNLVASVSDTYKGRVSPGLAHSVMGLSEELNIRPDYLLAVMGFETGYSFSPKQRPISEPNGAVGLIQFTQIAIDDLNNVYNSTLSKASLLEMSQLEQMEWVGRYFRMRRSRNLPANPTLDDVYLSVFWPSAVGKDANYVVLREGDLGWEGNKGLDYSGDGVITKSEISSRIFTEYAKLFGNATGGAISGGSQSTSMVEYTNRENNVEIDIQADFVDRASLARFIEQRFSEVAR